jgi:hypothetical protein
VSVLRRLPLVGVVFFLWAPAAYGWSWPVQGPVLQAFSYDEVHPYASGQHRGVDIGVEAAGDPVAAPAGGTITFAGTVPTSGECVTIETADGYSVTLTHLGSILAVRGAEVAEGDSVGTAGPSGTPEVQGPYVHLGIRVTADENGYVDPLSLLQAADDQVPSEGDPGDQSAPPASSDASPQPAPSATPAQARPVTGKPSVAPSPPAIVKTPATRHGVQPARGRRAPTRGTAVPGASEDVAAGVDRKDRTDGSRATGKAADHAHRHRRPAGDLAPRAFVAALPPRRRIVPVGTPRRRPTRALGEPLQQAVTPLLPVALGTGPGVMAATAALLVALRRRRRRFAEPGVVEGALLHLPTTGAVRLEERRAA